MNSHSKRPLSPSMRSPDSKAILMALCIACLVAGCGGSSEPSFTREQVESSMTDALRGNLDDGDTMDQLSCVMDGDEYHWTCITYVRRAGTPDSQAALPLTISVTCDAETLECISRT